MGKENIVLKERAKDMGYLNFLLNKRCWLKALSWRLLATSTTILLLTLFGFKLEVAASAGISINLFKTFIFYLHERLWEAKGP